jgi:hypothetical protein
MLEHDHVMRLEQRLLAPHIDVVVWIGLVQIVKRQARQVREPRQDPPVDPGTF